MYDTDNCSNTSVCKRSWVSVRLSQSFISVVLSPLLDIQCDRTPSHPADLSTHASPTLRHYRSSQRTVQGSVGVTWGRDALLNGESVQTSNYPKNKTWSAGFGHYETRIRRHYNRVTSDPSCCAQCACGHPAVCVKDKSSSRMFQRHRAQ